MRIHANTLTRQQIAAALDDERAATRVAFHVSFKQLTEHRSSIASRAFEIQLEAERRDNGRHAGNSGSYGATHDGTYAATFDEWGWLLAALYAADARLVVGSPSKPTYRNVVDFHRTTGLSYAPQLLAAELAEREAAGFPPEARDPYPWVLSTTGARIGRQGYARSADAPRWLSQEKADAAVQRWRDGTKQGNRHVKFLPRTLEQVAEFAHLPVPELRRRAGVAR